MLFNRPYATLLCNAISSGYMSAPERQLWADGIIGMMDHPPRWLLEVATSTSIVSIVNESFLARWEETKRFGGTNIDDAIIGYLRLRYERGDMTFEELLNESGRRADAGGASKDCEWFFEILTDWERSKTAIERSEIMKRADSLLQPFREIALDEFEQLNSI